MTRKNSKISANSIGVANSVVSPASASYNTTGIKNNNVSSAAATSKQLRLKKQTTAASLSQQQKTSTLNRGSLEFPLRTTDV